ncbi:MAG: hypothetical protein EOO38_13370 [Cytophagaceae bacterium]|nr:MAG: hypothetical protein EOO38_13370 [Cytophagaceae bacterium]
MRVHPVPVSMAGGEESAASLTARTLFSSHYPVKPASSDGSSVWRFMILGELYTLSSCRASAVQVDVDVDTAVLSFPSAAAMPGAPLNSARSASSSPVRGSGPAGKAGVGAPPPSQQQQQQQQTPSPPGAGTMPDLANLLVTPIAVQTRGTEPLGTPSTAPLVQVSGRFVVAHVEADGSVRSVQVAHSAQLTANALEQVYHHLCDLACRHAAVRATRLRDAATASKNSASASSGGLGSGQATPLPLEMRGEPCFENPLQRHLT